MKKSLNKPDNVVKISNSITKNIDNICQECPCVNIYEGVFVFVCLRFCFFNFEEKKFLSQREVKEGVMDQKD